MAKDRQDVELGVRAEATDAPDTAPLPDSDLDLADTTSIRQGAQAVTGKAVWSASRMSANEKLFASYDTARREQDERDEAFFSELQHLAAWNKELTIVGGLAMTNEDAQNARQHVIDNDEAYADAAIAKGQISEGDREDFKRGVRRKKELEDKRGRGTMNEADIAEAKRLAESKIGTAIDNATADAHLEWKMQRSAGLVRDDGNVALREDGAVRPETSEALARYAQLSAAAQNTAPATGAPVSQKVQATGLDL